MASIDETQTSRNEAGADFVYGSLNYIVESTERPVYYAYEPPPGVPRHSGTFDPQSIPIRNGRPLLRDLSLDKQGFEVTHHQTAVKDFYDREEVERVYYPEIENLLKQETGASKVVIFDHQVRNIQLFERGERGAREYAKIVHNDYTAKSGPRRVSDHLSPDEADELLKHRFAEINVWRPIRGPIESSPLAVCDAASIAPDDFVASDLIYNDKVGETYRFKYNPNHRWFYFPLQQQDEAILLKCYDSKEDGRARFTAHTSFEDPSSPASAAPRESIEVRALVFWPNEERV